jgi:hypothetical protein
MAKIDIEGEKYLVVESLGLNHNVGTYCKLVRDGDRERMAVKRGGKWVFWTAQDRVKPLLDAIACGWRPGDAPSARGQ